MTVSDAERDYYHSVLATLQAGVDKLSLQDLRYAYFLAALNGDLPGAALPPGGALGDVLTKKSPANGDADWAAPSDGGGSSYELRGTGFPEGVVTANPGTYYTDTAATNGAWRWLKKSGTGSTGWSVVVGDTGWRRIGGTADALGAHIRRQGTTVFLQWAVMDSSLLIPSGFRAQFWISLTCPDGNGTDFRFVGVNDSHLLYTVPESGRPGVSVSWPTSDPWPVALPGTPA